MFQLEFFGDFFPVGDPRRCWACNGPEDGSLEDAIEHYINNSAQCKVMGYTPSPGRVRNLETNEIVMDDDQLKARLT